MKKVFFLLAVMWLSSCARIHLVEVKDPLTPAEHMRLAAVYESKGEEDLAIKEYGKAAAGEESADAYFAMGNLYLRMKRLSEAEASYRKALRIKPMDGPIYNNLGWVYIEKGELDKAEAACREALKLDGSREYVYLDTLGVIQTRRKDYAGAEASLKKAASLTPSSQKEGLSEILNHLLELYNGSGDGIKAAEIEKRIKGLN